MSLNNVFEDFKNVEQSTKEGVSGKPLLDMNCDRSKMLLCRAIQQFKRACTIEIKQRKLYKDMVWQRSFYDRVIRSESELYLTRRYIKENPANWQKRRILER